MKEQWDHKILNVREPGFESLALEIFQLQYTANPVYKSYVDALGKRASAVVQLDQIPFLPIRFFKSHQVRTGRFEPALVFESSGTTGSINSRHYINDAFLYKESFIKGFELFYGPVKNWCFLGLLPSYLERNNSSLVYMVSELIKESGHPQSGFYLHDYDKLSDTLRQLEEKGQKTLLIGVTFALLDFADQFGLPLQHTIVMETGGMKGRRKEMVRPEIHDVLKKAFGVSSVHSEYGMTELLSQAWSKGEGVFKCPPWMKIMLRDEEDPLMIKRLPILTELATVSGAINVIDLANVHSCSFIASDDAGKLNSDGSFEVLGRMDNSDLRGCSLMAV